MPSLREICRLALIYDRTFDSLITELKRDAERTVQRTFKTLPKRRRKCAATFNREHTLKWLEKRLDNKTTHHAGV